jgi:hypothetical protein
MMGSYTGLRGIEQSAHYQREGGKEATHGKYQMVSPGSPIDCLVTLAITSVTVTHSASLESMVPVKEKGAVVAAPFLKIKNQSLRVNHSVINCV